MNQFNHSAAGVEPVDGSAGSAAPLGGASTSAADPFVVRTIVSTIQHAPLPDPAMCTELLRRGAQHLEQLADGLTIDAPQLRAQLMALADQAGGVERLARRLLELLARRAA